MVMVKATSNAEDEKVEVEHVLEQCELWLGQRQMVGTETMKPSWYIQGIANKTWGVMME